MSDGKRYFRNKVASNSKTTSSSTSSPLWQAPPQQPQQQWDSETCTTIARQLMKKCLDHYEGEPSSPKRSSRKAPKTSFGTLYQGALGARVYLRLRMALHLKAVQEVANTKPAAKKTCRSTRHPHDNEIQSLLHDAMKVAEEAAKIDRDRMEHHRIRVTLLEGALVGAKCMLAALYHHVGQEERCKEEADELLKFLQEHTASLDPKECEVLYGRAGALQAIFFLRQELGDEVFGSQEAVVIAQSIVNQGLETADSAKSSSKDKGTKVLPLLWEWHKKCYLGAAHGVVGILHTLLCLKKSELDQITTRQKGGNLLSLIQESIQALGSYYCWESGNLFSSIGSSEDKLVHWCHGAPGHVLLLVKAHGVFQDASLLQKAREIGDKVIWPRGLLRKGTGLCHGIPGNGYCLLALGRPNRIDQDDDGKDDKKSDATVDAQHQQQSDPLFYMKQACYFAAFSLEKWSALESVPDNPFSLQGAGGLALLMMDLGTLTHKNNHKLEHANLRDARFPLYDF